MKYILPYKLPEPYTNKENQEMFIRYKENGDLEARSLLIEHNQHLILSFLNNKFSNPCYFEYLKICGLTVEDLFTECIFYLIKAIELFDHKKGFQFSTLLYIVLFHNVTRFFSRGENKKIIKFNPLTDSIEDLLDENESDTSKENYYSYKKYLMEKDDIYEDFVKFDMDKIIKYVNEIETIRDRIIIKIYINNLFYEGRNEKVITQPQMAKMLNVSQAQISRVIKKHLKNMRELIS